MKLNTIFIIIDELPFTWSPSYQIDFESLLLFSKELLIIEISLDCY
jgi:hypothetical protein